MRNFLLILSLVSISASLHAQKNVGFMPGYSTKVIGASPITAEMTGSPFVESDFEQGLIIDTNGDGKSQPAFLRYNVLEDVVEVKIDKIEETSFVLPKVKNLEYKLDAYTYILNSFRTSNGNTFEGYFMRYFKGDKVNFYARPHPNVFEAQKATTGYGSDKPAHFDIKTDYFLATENGILQPVKLKEKDFKKALPASKEVDKYLSSNKLKSIEEFVEFLAWYDTRS